MSFTIGKETTCIQCSKKHFQEVEETFKDINYKAENFSEFLKSINNIYDFLDNLEREKIIKLCMFCDDLRGKSFKVHVIIKLYKYLLENKEYLNNFKPKHKLILSKKLIKLSGDPLLIENIDLEKFNNYIDLFLEKNEHVKALAFQRCTNLRTFHIPNSVIYIGYGAFRYCTNLRKLHIPSSVISIGHGAFQHCTSLETVNISKNIDYIGCDAFQHCTSLETVNIPSSVISIGHSAFQHCTSLETVNISKNLNCIGCDVFQYCTSLKSVIIPSSVTKIGHSAFQHCRSLKSVIIPDSVTFIGIDAFENCTSLESVIVPDSVDFFGHDAFKNCNMLKNVIAPLKYQKFFNNVNFRIYDSALSLIRYKGIFNNRLSNCFSKDIKEIYLIMLCINNRGIFNLNDNIINLILSMIKNTNLNYLL